MTDSVSVMIIIVVRNTVCSSVTPSSNLVTSTSVRNELFHQGIPQTIELNDNAAYCSVLPTQSAPHCQSIEVNDYRQAFGATKETVDEIYY